MRNFRKIWSGDKNAWFLAHKDTNKREAYIMFLEAFPDAATITETAFNNQRSKLGAVPFRRPHASTKCRPLYSEQEKNGYIRIKIAQPNKWVLKSAWVYMETHPWEDFTERSNYIFLDGDNRNFSPDNIERVPLKLMGIFCNLGGTEKGQPETTRARLAQARLKHALLDAGEKLGLTVSRKNCRKFRDERNLRAKILQKKARQDPERHRKMLETQRKRLERIRTEEPERWERMRQDHKVKAHEWYLKNKEKIHDRRRVQREI